MAIRTTKHSGIEYNDDEESRGNEGKAFTISQLEKTWKEDVVKQVYYLSSVTIAPFNTVLSPKQYWMAAGLLSELQFEDTATAANTSQLYQMGEGTWQSSGAVGSPRARGRRWELILRGSTLGADLISFSVFIVLNFTARTVEPELQEAMGEVGFFV